MRSRQWALMREYLGLVKMDTRLPPDLLRAILNQLFLDLSKRGPQNTVPKEGSSNPPSQSCSLLLLSSSMELESNFLHSLERSPPTVPTPAHE